MRPLVIMNPGTGPVGGASSRHAHDNVCVLVKDAVEWSPLLKGSTITFKRTGKPWDGRYDFKLRRGQAEVDVSMPGLPIENVRFTNAPGQNAWNFPRLYVDGNSWLWEFAIHFVAWNLADHDGSLEEACEASRRAVEMEIQRCPRCPTCNTVRQERQRNEKWHHFGQYEVLCLGCTPRIYEDRVTATDAVYTTDAWKRQPHYFKRTQLMPPEATQDEGGVCGADLSLGGNACRLRRGHADRCEGYYKVLERTYVDPMRDEAPSL